jgi:tetratricopeptide (TPR) repeat protein
MEHRLLGETLTPDLDKGGYFDLTVTVTKLAVNTPLPADALDFRFPENLEVQENIPGTDETKFYIWGPDNKPAREFDSVAEFNAYEEKQNVKKLAARVQKNQASKLPKDLLDRGQYYFETKKYDEAAAVFSEVLAGAPEKQDRETALCARGMAYLLYLRQYDKAIADFTEMLRLAKGEEDGVSVVHLMRALAYAHREDAWDKVQADLTEFMKSSMGEPSAEENEMLYWAYLLRAAAAARQNGSDAALPSAIKDAEKALTVHRGADAYAVLIWLLEKAGHSDKAVKLRKAAVRGADKSALSVGIETDMDAAVHECLVRALPGMGEKPGK